MTSTTIIQLPCGPIQAIRQDGIIRVRGIPYARAQRFQPPIKAPSHTDLLDCTQPATICPQDPTRLENVMGSTTTVGHEQSEACLHLSFTAPEIDVENNKNVPVMVFFHGGAYVSGGGDLDIYSGWPLTAQENVVVVSVTSRLSMFGYLRIPGIAPANLGLMDQIAALQWVQENVSAFGGDKDNVTIFGQSAGGDSVFCLLLAEHEAAKGLFHKAIVQSAPFSWYRSSRKQKMVDTLGEYAATQLGNHLAVNGATKIEINADTKTAVKPSAAELLDLKRKLQVLGVEVDPESILIFGTELGQWPLPSAQLVDETLLKVAKRIPIMIGWVANEGTAFVPSPTSASKDAERITERDFVSGAKYFHNIISQEQQSPTFTFAWSPQDSVFGATHCIELPFLLGTPGAWNLAPMLGTSEIFSKAADTVGVQLKAFWAGFAREETHNGTHHVLGVDR